MTSSFQRRLRQLGFLTYEDYLSSPGWKRRAARHRKESCYCCGGRNRLQVHHRSYARLGRERGSDLVTVCDGCHKKLHQLVSNRECGLAVAHVVLRGEKKRKIS